MNSCLPFLLGKTDQRPETKIANAPLLESEHPVSSSDDEEEMNERKRRLRRQSWQHRQRQHVDADKKKSISLRSGLIHEKDFYLIGANTWTLLSSKFGYDVSLPRPCRLAATESKLAVAVETRMTPVPVPPSGRFSYSESPHVVAPQSDDVSENDDMVCKHMQLTLCIYNCVLILSC
jgi:hypothetical protein